MPIFMVERVFVPAISEEQFMQAGKAIGPCIAERDVTHISSHFALDGSRSICMYEAADAERVREANRTAGAPFEKVWLAKKFG